MFPSLLRRVLGLTQFVARQVQRVKNKWKVTLKDGLISVNGKDYLFSKCNGYVCSYLSLPSLGTDKIILRCT
jgi:hypothetical protein